MVAIMVRLTFFMFCSNTATSMILWVGKKEIEGFA